MPPLQHIHADRSHCFECVKQKPSDLVVTAAGCQLQGGVSIHVFLVDIRSLALCRERVRWTVMGGERQAI
jgi:hypothetical protein